MCSIKLCLSVSFVLVFGLAGSAIAQDIYYWTNASGDGMWNRDTEPYNWGKTPAWNPDGPRTPCPPPSHDSGVVWISRDPNVPTALDTPLVIPAGYTADCTYGEDYGTIYGPEWGLQLDIYGSLTYRWYLVLAQTPDGLIDPNNPDNDPNRSVINMYSGSRIHGTEDSPGDPTRAEGIALGTNWWEPWPYVTMNMYEGSECLFNWAWIGGHLNMYGGTFDVLTGVNMGIGTPNNVPDELIRVDIYEGKLILPSDFTDEVEDWINRGILKAYGMTPGLPKNAQIVVDTVAIPDRTIVTAIPQSPPEASEPNPANDATYMRIDPNLSWRTGRYADKHDVYFGTNPNDVENASSVSHPNVMFTNVNVSSFEPGTLEFNTTYYWRIDEVNDLNPDSPWVGDVWSFTTGNFLVVDDFEDYDDFDNRIYSTWVDYFVNHTGMTVGHLEAPFAEQSIVHDGRQSMYMRYDNDGTVNEGTELEQAGTLLYSEAQRSWETPQDWTRRGVTSLTLWFRGIPASVGSFTVGPPITITAGGADIWGMADEFHFAYKRLSSLGSITARVVSVTDTDPWAKAGVMIRESLEPGAAHGAVVVTPGQGVTFQYRDEAGVDSQEVAAQAGITAPHWVRLMRSGNTFTADYSANGSTWETLGSMDMPMLADTYIGLALTSHNVNETCTAEFSNVTITGTVSGEWQSQDIGIESNIGEPMYAVLEDSAGNSVIVTHPDPAASAIGDWTEWNIPFTDFIGVNLSSVKAMYSGVGNRTTPQAGSAGDLYIDDIRLNLPSLAE